MSRFEAELRQLQDVDYRDFQCRLMPTVDPQTVIGVRTPQLKALAKQLWQKRQSECEAFLQELPHIYYEENNLHAFLLMQEKEFSVCLERTQAFLPYIDNWATCDSLMPPVFKKQAQELLPNIRSWLSCEHTYTCRFGIGCLLSLFLGERFRPEYLQWVAVLRSSEYYINMMIAWYFSEALVKQYEEAVVYLREYRLERWTHNKAIQKAVESFRISAERKQALKALRRKKEV
ncbi:MAG: DNA alkylation repair protein [Eubacteriales bacterium]|nr:DNA alkylation repair protein [Eubacteriales bacterium]